MGKTILHNHSGYLQINFFLVRCLCYFFNRIIYTAAHSYSGEETRNCRLWGGGLGPPGVRNFSLSALLWLTLLVVYI